MVWYGYNNIINQSMTTKGPVKASDPFLILCSIIEIVSVSVSFNNCFNCFNQARQSIINYTCSRFPQPLSFSLPLCLPQAVAKQTQANLLQTGSFYHLSHRGHRPPVARNVYTYLLYLCFLKFHHFKKQYQTCCLGSRGLS